MKLYPHQEAAIKKLNNGSILCGNVGSGKSLTSLGYFMIKESNGKPTRDLYIITTARKRDTGEWEAECNQFLLSTNPENSIYDISVTIDSWNNIEKYKDVQDAFFIFDEQRVVGSGKWSKNFIKIALRNRWILLSATPGDTWMDYIPVFIANGFYKNRTEFLRRHVVFDPYVNFPKVRKYIDVDYLVKLKDHILVTMLIDLPAEKHSQDIICRYDEDMYNMAFKDRWHPYEDRPIINASELCQILRKICNTDVSRIDELQVLLSIHPKAIIFYNYDYELNILKNLNFEGFEVAEWNGHKHEEIPKSDKWIYLVQYTAGAEGWNCIETNTIIFYSNSYSYKQMVQAAGRVDRLNTPFDDIFYYYLTSNSNIDKSIKRCLDRKQDFNERSFALK